jgi:hypothetical protein
MNENLKTFIRIVSVGTAFASLFWIILAVTLGGYKPTMTTIFSTCVLGFVTYRLAKSALRNF